MAPAGLHIEPGRIEDARAIAQIHAEGFPRGWPISEFSDYLADTQGAAVLIACNSRRQIAGFALFRLSGDEGELLTLAVGRKWRGKGIGAAIMRAAFEDLPTSSVRRVFLEVEEGNAPALALYRRLGFTQIGTRKAYYPKPDGSAATAQVMRAEIG